MYWYYILITLIAFVAMEALAWFMHKYVMHGFMWNWHKSHHSPNEGIFERNDLFAVLFSIPAVGSMMIGLTYREEWYWLFWTGIGITLYGVVYFVFHDIIVHRRIRFNARPGNPYLKNIIRAHKVHHKNRDRNKGEAFGFLYSAKKYTAE
ncbi:beta-carotene hydroxylase [Rhodocytophaga rosea]|uniref:Beta-carotene hydroxylase n=1 Tax=Rhodocytophaga rosea TaxID=2704465 RepID=A0A6C0GFH3_9BACT|nr:sterol desaturase family protein [Rhodocytophaga rosea]QHT66523.1 beta-carotene hydroxylase [Rhodocytophaga rosea]